MLRFLHVGVIVLFIVEGVGFAFGNVVPTAFKASFNAFLLASLAGLAYYKQYVNKSK